MWTIYQDSNGFWGYTITCRLTGYKESRSGGYYSSASAAFAAQYAQFSLTLEERREKCRTINQSS